MALLVSAAGWAQADGSTASRLPLVLFDGPQTWEIPHRAPTWEQTLDVSGGLAQAGHWGIHRGFQRLSDAWWSKVLEVTAITTADLFLELWPGPGGMGWAHEEGHRAAMVEAGLPHSKQVFLNWFYPQDQRCDPGSVCGMTDEEIAASKRRRSADWVRVQEAGMETELELARRSRSSTFFSRLPGRVNTAYLWLNAVQVLGYRHACADTRNSFGEDEVEKESPDMLRRDFTGPDCTGWVTDLFRPDEPYEARGPHPYGGVRRIRFTRDLTFEEQSFLRQVRNLGLLNLLDPGLAGFSRFSLATAQGRIAFLPAVSHHLTAFGDAFALELLLETGSLQLEGALRAYRNQEQVLPGLTAGWLRRSFAVGGHAVVGSATLDLWLQPQGFAWATRSVMPGGALELTAGVPLGSWFETFVTVRAKTAGWRAVDPELDAGISARMGLALHLPVLDPVPRL